MFFSACRLVLRQELDELCRQDAAEPGSNFAELWGLKQLLNSVRDELHVNPDSPSLWFGFGTRLPLLPSMKINGIGLGEIRGPRNLRRCALISRPRSEERRVGKE